MSIETEVKLQVLTVLSSMTKLVIDQDRRLHGWFYWNEIAQVFVSYKFLYNDGVWVGGFSTQELAVDAIMKIGE